MPHIAPEAWLHQIYAPLAENDIALIEDKLGQAIPADLRQFLHLANGVGLFSGSLSIYGKRTSFGRSGDEVWQPFCIVTANTLDRPPQAKDGQLVIGSYRNDGSLVFIDSKDGTVFRTKSRSKKPLNRWPDLWTFFRCEVSRLSTCFDNQGRKTIEGPTTPPADN